MKQKKETPIGFPYWGLWESAKAVASGSREISFFNFGPILGDAPHRTIYLGVRIRLRIANEHPRFLSSVSALLFYSLSQKLIFLFLTGDALRMGKILITRLWENGGVVRGLISGNPQRVSDDC